MSLFTKRVAALATAAGLAVMVAAPVAAHAGDRAPERHELTRPARSPDDDAEGVVKVERGRKGDTMVVRLKHLDAKTVYQVRDADTDALLGTVRTNKKGKAKLRLRVGAGSAAKSGSVAGDVDGIAVYRDGDEEFCLVGRVARDGKDGGNGPVGDPSFGDAFYGTLRGPNASISLFTDGDGYDSFYASLCADTGEGLHGFELYVDDVGGGSLPLGVDSVTDLAGRAFDIVDADGDEVLAGDLPELLDLDDLWNGLIERMPFETEGEDDTRTFTAPFTLRIADSGGTLTDAGTFDEVEYGYPGDFRSAFEFFGSYDGANGALSMYADDLGDTFSVSLWVPSEDDAWGGSYVEYVASSYGGEGDLPLDVDSLDDLSGRAYELRNGAGSAFVTGTIPELASDNWGLGWEDARDDEGSAITPGEGPYTIWIANGAGTLTEVGTLTAPEWDTPMPPIDFAWGEVSFGAWDGVNGGIFLYEQDGYASFTASLSVPGTSRNDWGDYYSLWFDRADGKGDLPLGVTSLGDLSGRDFELRNGAGTAFVTGTLPELTSSDDLFADPLGGDRDGEGGSGSAIRPGSAPYTLWIEDDGGTLRNVGTLEAFDWEIDFGDDVVIFGGVR